MLLKLPPLKWNDHEARNRGIVLIKGMLSVLMVITVTFATATVLQPQFSPRYISIVATIWIISLVLLGSLKETNAKTIATLYIVFLLFMIVGFSWSGGGIKGHGISLLPLVVAFAGLTVGRKQIWYFCSAAIAGGLILTVAYYANWLPVYEALGHSPLIYWIYSMTGILAITYIEFLSVNRLQKALDETKSELRLREESEEKYKRIIESFQDIYYQTDMQGNLTMITPSIQTRAGHVPEQLIGKPVTYFYSNPTQRDEFLTALQQNGSVYGYDLELIGSKGNVINVIASSRVMYNEEGHATGIEGILHDITERKKAEEALKMKNETLMEIAFLQSHIVRSPLTNILGIINLINTEKPDDPVNMELIPELAAAAKQLDAVVHRIVQKTNEIRKESSDQAEGDPV